MTYNPNGVIRPQRFERQTPHAFRNVPFVIDERPTSVALVVGLCLCAFSLACIAAVWL